jgi:hypothetical protein
MNEPKPIESFDIVTGIERIGYQAALARVRVARGRAAAHLCVDCARPADEWSYNRDDPAEQLQLVSCGRPYGRYRYRVAYGLDPIHYSPRCRSCSRRLSDRRHPQVKRRAPRGQPIPRQDPRTAEIP